MKELVYKYMVFAIALGLASPLALSKSRRSAKSEASVFIGEISDSMCGMKHPMSDARRCTLGCVKGFQGTTFVLADQEHQKVYNLSDQGKAKKLAGKKVEVRGTLSGDTIHVISMKAAN